ncbi:hypothetical protein [Polaribacter sp. SA4-12]|uniref:hypothetical protein n=1 Tax=Polaribacter sp. SA4-12 TaxID=1312072 RepID=UPI000B3D36EB|nr:hypothetical protein [Polaribacter sp. SA4-12]ARV15896.1 hypothetical protein BTO07_12420 [Polaribacter sp. SA4-12]
MNNQEYIEFTLSDASKFKDCNKVFNILIDCKKNGTKKKAQFWLKRTPDYVIDYLNLSEKNKSWSLIKLFQFIIEDLDVTFTGLEVGENGTGRLDFEVNGYPYGGPSSLITFLRAFDCIATETDDGSGVYKVSWKSDFKFQLKKEASDEPKGLKSFFGRIFNK